MTSKKMLVLVTLLTAVSLLLIACQPEEVVKEVVVTQEVIVTQEVEVEKEVIVEKEVEKEVVVTVEVEAEMPEETQVIFAPYQEPQILNDFIATQTASGETTASIVEGLIGVNAQVGSQLMRKPYFQSSSCSKPGAADAYMTTAWGLIRTPAMGSVCSQAPPASDRSSSTQTLSPHLARYAARATPLGPAPIMTMSYLSSVLLRMNSMVILLSLRNI